jgi:hypothetical protein
MRQSNGESSPGDSRSSVMPWQQTSVSIGIRVIDGRRDGGQRCDDDITENPQ